MLLFLFFLYGNLMRVCGTNCKVTRITTWDTIYKIQYNANQIRNVVCNAGKVIADLSTLIRTNKPVYLSSL
jgi:hypothetical protein